MINKKIDEISDKLETIKVLVQDNEYLNNVEKRCDEVNKRNQMLENRIQKAIEYIENNTLYKEEIDYDYEETPIYVGCNDLKAREELLEILKGNEENK